MGAPPFSHKRPLRGQMLGQFGLRRPWSGAENLSGERRRAIQVKPASLVRRTDVPSVSGREKPAVCRIAGPTRPLGGGGGIRTHERLAPLTVFKVVVIGTDASGCVG